MLTRDAKNKGGCYRLVALKRAPNGFIQPEMLLLMWWFKPLCLLRMASTYAYCLWVLFWILFMDTMAKTRRCIGRRPPIQG